MIAFLLLGCSSAVVEGTSTASSSGASAGGSGTASSSGPSGTDGTGGTASSGGSGGGHPCLAPDPSPFSQCQPGSFLTAANSFYEGADDLVGACTPEPGMPNIPNARLIGDKLRVESCGLVAGDALPRLVIDWSGFFPGGSLPPWG